MKILFATTYIYKQEYLEFSRNKTGFGMMVNSLYEELSKTNDVYLISYVLTKGHRKIVRHRGQEVFFCAKAKDYRTGLYYFKKYKQSFGNRIRYLYYGVNSGFIRKRIRSINPDIVHIHGIGIALKPYIDVCEELNVPYVVTLHGLIGIDSSLDVKEWDKEYEKDFLIRASENNIPVSVISTGIKKRIEKNYLKHTASNIIVINNGIKRKETSSIQIEQKNRNSITICNSYKTTHKNALDHYLMEYKTSIREGCYLPLYRTIEYLRVNILCGKKIVVCIGNISENKNQLQLCRVLKNNSLQDVIGVMLGIEADGGKVRRYIIENNLEEKLILQGFCDELNSIWNCADINVVLSKNEGFGLSIIEGYQQGVPVVMFSDLDAAEDVYDKTSTLYINNRKDESVATAIVQGLLYPWDRQKIISCSKRFYIDRIGQQYIDMYHRIISTATMGDYSKKCRNLEYPI